eukprot:TRINITY_DN5290_c0_g1_i1.p1 TRINITY_DN5290_c0_g1~~TRINITY_DN5290_c0_g1_i1.p1  ORF type:complete len:1682 (+),score=487.71 TRINITY_DN5290_c0_g1_i1:68-5047(+)
MPTSYVGSGRVSPPRRCSAAAPSLTWSRWVSGKRSDWRSRAECAVAGQFLALSGTSSSRRDAPADSTFVYDLQRLAWSSHTSTGEGPLDADEHICCSVGADIFVWWAQGDALQCSRLDTQSWAWSPCSWDGDPLPTRRGFTASADPATGLVVIYGGTDSMGLPCGAAHVIRLADGWSKRLGPRSAPPPRERHAACIIPAGVLRELGAGPHLVVWGGRSPSGTALGDMWALDLAGERWHEVPQGAERPSPRWRHSLVLLGGLLVLYGGESGFADPVRVYSLAARRWLPFVPPEGDVPPPRAGHYAAASCDGEHVVVFGGAAPGGGEQYYDLYALHVSAAPEHSAAPDRAAELPAPVMAGGGAAAVDDIGLSPPRGPRGGSAGRAYPAPSPGELSQEVQLLHLERERERLDEENRRLKAWEDDGQREQVAKAVAMEHAKWDRGARQQREELVEELDRVASERDEAYRQRDELLAAIARRAEEDDARDRRRQEEDARLTLRACELEAAERRLAEREAEAARERQELGRERSEWEGRVAAREQDLAQAEERVRAEFARLEREQARLEQRDEERAREAALEREHLSSERRRAEELWEHQRRDAEEEREIRQEEKAELQRIRQEVQELRDSLGQDRANLRAELEQRALELDAREREMDMGRGALQDANRALQEHCGALQERAGELEGRAARAESELSAAQEQLAAAHEQLDDCRRQLADPRVSPRRSDPRPAAAAAAAAAAEAARVLACEEPCTLAPPPHALAGEGPRRDEAGPRRRFSPPGGPPGAAQLPGGGGALGQTPRRAAAGPADPAAAAPASYEAPYEAPYEASRQRNREAQPPPPPAAPPFAPAPFAGGGCGSRERPAAQLEEPERALSPGSAAFLEQVLADAARGCGAESGAVPLPVLLKLVRALQLLRGTVTVDTVLDVLHAAQIALAQGAQGGQGAVPPLADTVGADLFRVVVGDLINRIYGSGAEGSSLDVAVVEAHINGPLRKLWTAPGGPVAFPRDPVLDCILSLPVAEVLHRHRNGLFTLFCSAAGIHKAGASEPQLRPSDAITPRQAADLGQRVGVIPQWVSRELLMTRICPLCNDPAAGGLPPAALAECLCRAALWAAAPGPDPTAVLNPVAAAQRCSALIQQAVSAHKAQQRAAKQPQPRGSVRRHSSDSASAPPRPAAPSRASPRGRSSTRTSSPASSAGGTHSAAQPQMSHGEARVLLRDREHLQLEAQRIWLYYSALPAGGGSSGAVAGGGPSCGVGLPQWLRLLQDCKCMASLRDYAGATPQREVDSAMRGLLPPRDAEGLYADAQRESAAPHGAALGFDAWMVALRRVACAVHPALAASPHDALQRLLLERVLPHAMRVPSAVVAPYPDPQAVADTLARYRRGFAMLFAAYANQGDGSMTVSQFSRMCQDFGISPALLSKQEVLSAFRCGLLADAPSAAAGRALGAEALQHVVARAAAIAFGKHPYAQRLPAVEHRVAELCERLSLGDTVQLRKQIERAGLRLPAQQRGTPPRRAGEPQGLTSPPRRRGACGPPPDAGVSAAEELIEDEARLDAALRAVFAAYVSRSAGAGTEAVGIAAWLRFCDDTRVVDHSDFPPAAAEAVYADAVDQATRADPSAAGLVFDDFCDALLILGARRFPHLAESDALRRLLTLHVVPLASRHH